MSKRVQNSVPSTADVDWREATDDDKLKVPHLGHFENYSSIRKVVWLQLNEGLKTLLSINAGNNRNVSFAGTWLILKKAHLLLSLTLNFVVFGPRNWLDRDGC